MNKNYIGIYGVIKKSLNLM